MGLYVSTTGTDVEIPELGFSLPHPSTDYALSDQFSDEEIQGATSLTDLIRTGALAWKKTSGGAAEIATNYDPDYLEAYNLNTGDGVKADRLASFKDLPQAGAVASTDFTGNPKTAAVTLPSEYPDNNYAVLITGSDSRTWSADSRLSTGFIINSHANQPLTGPVSWETTYRTT